MKHYHIYKNNVGNYEAVKEGWSWPAFFFTWIWCFVKKINSVGFGVLIYTIITMFFPIEFDLILIIIGIGINIWLGSSGNKMRKTNLISRGFQFQGSVNAPNPDAAISDAADNIPTKDIKDEVDFTIKDDQDEDDTVISTSSIFLEFLNGSLSGQRIMIFKDTTIGRASENDIVLSEKTISSYHCKIKVIDDEFVVEDLNSTNGTFIDGERISEQNLKQEDELRLSSIKIKVH